MTTKTAELSPHAGSPAPKQQNKYALPVSFAQQRLWVLDQLQPGNPAYSIPWAIQISGPLDLKALERTLNEIVRRHGVLRTSFSLIDGEPMQVISESVRIPLPVIDLISFSDRQAEA